MSHPGEHQIGMYVLDPTRVDERVRDHIRACKVCRDVADDMRAFDARLAEPATWIRIEPRGMDEDAEDELQAFDSRMATEYEAAVELLAEYENRHAAPRFAAYGVAKLPAMQNTGAVKRLCEMAHRMCLAHPLYALTLSEAAVDISAGLPKNAVPRGAVYDLRGEAWKEKANALTQLGRYPEALEALDRAEEHFRQLRQPGIGLVSVQYVRAHVLMEQDHFERAAELAGLAAEGARNFGDSDRYRMARHLLGTIEANAQRFNAAIEVFDELLADAEERHSPEWIALEALNKGLCLVEMGCPKDGAVLLQRALTLYTQRKESAEAARARWGLARATALMSRVNEAIRELHAVIDQFRASGMVTDAAMAAVDLSELLLANGRSQEVVRLLSGVAQTFTKAGKFNGALVALSYLKDAAAARAVRDSEFEHVRRFLRSVERQPALVFSRPSVSAL